MDGFASAVGALAPALLLAAAALGMRCDASRRVALAAASICCAVLAVSGGTAADALRAASAACVPASLALLAANAVLQFRQRGVAVLSVLPLALAAAVALALLAPSVAGASCSGAARRAAQLLAAEALWFCVSLSAFSLGTWALRGLEPSRPPYRFIVVPGAALFGTRPCPLLETRLDRALDLWRQGGGASAIVVSGGQGADEEVSEAAAMRSYLEGRGVPPMSILDEDISATTEENLRCSKRVMDAAAGGEPYRAAIATSEFHAPRCMGYARRFGIDADAAPARSARASWARSVVREFLAVTAGSWWPYAAILLAWSAGLAS